jgi:hypothetical protein
MSKTAAEVEREVEASRNDLDKTVEALKDKMTPSQIFGDATRAMGGAGQQALSKLADQAKENPLPLAVIGLGLAWLVGGSLKGRSGGYSASDYREPRSFAGDGADGSGGLGDKASALVSDAKDKLSDTAGKMSQYGQRVTQYGQRAQRSLTGLVHEDPLLIGAAGLLIGAAIGAALPSTEFEDRTVGPFRDKVLRKGQELAQDGLQQAGGVAQAAYGTVKEELQKPAGDGADPVQRARDVARGAVQAGRAQLESPAN